MAVLFAEGYWPSLSNPAARRRRAPRLLPVHRPSRGFFFSLLLALIGCAPDVEEL